MDEIKIVLRHSPYTIEFREIFLHSMLIKPLKVPVSVFLIPYNQWKKGFKVVGSHLLLGILIVFNSLVKWIFLWRKYIIVLNHIAWVKLNFGYSHNIGFCLWRYIYSLESFFNFWIGAKKIKLEIYFIFIISIWNNIVHITGFMKKTAQVHTMSFFDQNYSQIEKIYMWNQ